MSHCFCSCTKFVVVFLFDEEFLDIDISECLDPSALTTISPKTTLAKGDLFAISLNEDATQKLLLQLDRVDDERTIQPAVPGMSICHLLSSI